jgi:P27 family predicted phage terminase small subunit
MTAKKKKYTRPEPPQDITGAAREEWDRICAAVEAMNRQIKPADRSILATYCRIWTVNQDVYQHILQHGAVVKWLNDMPGQSPQYKTFRETTQLLRALLGDIGCTPQSRDFDIEPEAQATEPAPLVF